MHTSFKPLNGQKCVCIYIFPNILIPYPIVLTIPVSVVSGERLFTEFMKIFKIIKIIYEIKQDRRG